MKVTAVIPTLNEESVIGRTLTAVCSQTLPFDQILVVDGGSTDSTISIASSFAGVEVIQSCPPVGHQRQAGLEKAAGDVVFFLDADTSPSADFVASCLAEMERRGLDIACPWYQPEPSSPAIGAVYAVFNLIFIALQRVLPSGAGSCIIVRRDLALKAGGFRVHLVYEDIEFIRRAARSGRFGALRTRIRVSDRRFRRYGVLRTAGKYVLLSLFFTFGMFKQAGLVPYRFADYESSGEELVVLVDEANRPAGTAAKSKVHGSCTPLHRAFSVFLFNPRGEVLLQQRSESKVAWPLAWSNSCCGHPGPEESIEQAARRRIREELGIEAVGLQVILPDFRYRAEQNGIVENEICPVLIGFAETDPVPDPAEVKAVRWISWPELLEMAGCEGALTPWCVQEALLLESSELFRQMLTSLSDERISC